MTTVLASPAPTVSGATASEAAAQFDELDDEILESLDGSANAVEEDDASATATPAAAAPASPASAQPASAAAAPSAAPVTPGAGAGDTPVAAAPNASVATPAATPPAAPVETPEQKAAREAETKASREKWLGELEQVYQVPKEDHDALLTSPETVLPKIAAKLHAQMVEVLAPQIAAQIMSALPAVLQQTTTFEQREAKAKSDFFSRYAHLNKPEYNDAILKAGVAYRQVHPDATPDEAMEGMAMLAARALKIQHVPYTGDGAPAPTVTAPQRKMPKPANAGGGKAVTPAPAANADDNPWADLAQNDDD